VRDAQSTTLATRRLDSLKAAAHLCRERASVLDDDDHEGDASRARQGLAISPVPVNLDDRNPALVGLGSYLVNAVAGCTDCHTHPNFAPGGNPYLGQPKKINAKNFLAGGRAFGPFVSRNLTPEGPFGRPAGLTFDQFEEVMRVGTDFDQAHRRSRRCCK